MNENSRSQVYKRNNRHPVAAAILKSAEEGLLAQGQGVILGFSGGPDSAALYHALVHSGLGLTVTPVHVNHMLRGAESDGDQAFCERTAKSYGGELLVYAFDVSAAAKERGLTIEEAGRDCRYSAFFKAMAQTSADVVAVAHNMDDNAETMILRFFRGTGLKGLTGIPRKNGNIVRPLLEVSHADILDYCEINGLAYRLDSSNDSNDYNRNWVRNVLTPQIKETLNPAMAEGLMAMAVNFQADEAFLSKSAVDAFEACLASNDEKHVTLDIAKLAVLDRAILHRVVMLAYNKLTGSVKDLSRRHIENTANLANKEHGKRVSLPGGVAVIKNAGRIELTFNKSILATPEFIYSTNYTDDICIKELGLTITFGPVQKDLKKLYTIRIGYDNISYKADVRSRLPGDTIKLAGVGRKSLKAFVNGLKLEPLEKSGLFVLAEGGEVVAVMTGSRHLRTSESFYAVGASNALIITIWEGNAR